MSFDSILEKRRCVRSFKPTKKVSWKDAAEVLNSARFAPTPGGIHALKIIVIEEQSAKKKIADACLGQAFIADATYLIVVCSDLEQITRSYGKKAEVYARQQAGAAIENMFLKITDMGLATCWIGAFDDNAVRRELQLPDTIQVEAVLPIGYELGKSKPTEKPELKRFVRFNNWKTKYTAGWESTATSNE